MSDLLNSQTRRRASRRISKDIAEDSNHRAIGTAELHLSGFHFLTTARENCIEKHIKTKTLKRWMASEQGAEGRTSVLESCTASFTSSC